MKQQKLNAQCPGSQNSKIKMLRGYTLWSIVCLDLVVLTTLDLLVYGCRSISVSILLLCALERTVVAGVMA